MAFQSKRTFELIDPSTFDSEAALRKAAKEYYRDLTFDGDDEGLEEDIWLARRPAACDPDNHPAVLVDARPPHQDLRLELRFRLRPPYLLTGWPMMAVPVLTDGAASSEDCFVRNPDGRLLDASGWVDVKIRYVGAARVLTGFSPNRRQAQAGQPIRGVR